MSVCKVWRLQGYARRVSSTDLKAGDWEKFDNLENNLEVTVTSTNQLLIHHGKSQMESLCISESKSWLKGMTKGDSLMVIMKIKDVSRQFRVKFSREGDAAAEDMCRQCVDLLSQHFQIKTLQGSTAVESSQIQMSGESTTDLVEDVTLGQIAQAITRTSSDKLPSIYDNLACETNPDLETIIKLCLSDPTFPAFVNTVETHLDNIVKDN